MLEDFQSPESPIPLKKADHPHDRAGSGAAPARICQARCEDIEWDKQKALVSRRERNSGQELEYLEGRHAKSDAGNDGDIVCRLHVQMSGAFSAGALSREPNICVNRLCKRADIAAEKPLQDREKAESI